MRQLTLILAAVMGAVILAGGIAVLEMPKPAEAQNKPETHFRASQLTWAKSANNEAEFDSTYSARRSYYSGTDTDGYPKVGDKINEPRVDFGDGNFEYPDHTVTSVDKSNDSLIAEATFKHTYSGSGPFTASISSCCRLSPPKHINNGDGDIRAETIVDFAKTVASPISSISPIIDCQKDSVCRFTVPAIDPDNQSLRFRLATADEASGSSNGFVQPGPPDATNAATIDQTSGLYQWDTTGATLAPPGNDTYYSTQVIVENVVGGNVVSKTPVDFFIRLTDQASTNQAPEFESPTPQDGTVINATVGSPITFDVKAHDDDASDTVTLGMLGKPSDATFNTTPGNPTTGNFSWTPTAIGSVILTLNAQDQTGLGATQRSVTINVTDAPGPGCTKEGTSGTDVLSGTSANDVLCGKGDLDVLYDFAGGTDTLNGDEGDDYLLKYDSDGDDTVDGGPGNDFCLADEDDTVVNCERVYRI